ncbi:WD40-repeat-containing domain protein [Entophlyctis helioformis]|nr:WD40-repeat-containing domain protein [Entophlyctis helioformis]
MPDPLAGRLKVCFSLAWHHLLYCTSGLSVAIRPTDTLTDGLQEHACCRTTPRHASSCHGFLLQSQRHIKSDDPSWIAFERQQDKAHMASEDIKNGKCVGVYRGHEGTVYSLDVHWKNSTGPNRPGSAAAKTRKKVDPEDPGSDTVCLVTGSHDQSIVVWEVQAGQMNKAEMAVKVEQVKRLKAHTGDVYALELITDPENHRRVGGMVSGGDYTIRTWNTELGTVNQTLHGHTGYVACLKVRGKRAFSGSWDTTIRSWNLETGKGMHVFKGHKNIVNCIDVIDTDIFSGSWDMTIIQWSRATGEPVHIYKGHTDGVQCIQYYEDHLYSGSMDKTIRVWNTKTAKTTKTFRGHQGGIECLHVVNGYCFSGSYDKMIRCFKIDSGDCVMLFSGHTDGVYCLKVFAGVLFSGSGDKSVRLWDVRDLVLARPKAWWKKLICCG